MTRGRALGELPKAQRRGAVPRHLLALSGGGFRGLFTARVLEHLESAGKSKLAKRFDLIGGTSIGGILAIGLACGIGAGELAGRMRAYGPLIFQSRRRSLWGYVGARYDSDRLRSAIQNILGTSWSERPFADLPAPLLVVAVDERMSAPAVFKTRLCSEQGASAVSALEVAMATSAAPTYFAPRQLDSRTFVDGGLIANAPDVVLIGEAMRGLGAALDDIHLCSVGTAGSARTGRAGLRPGRLGWLLRYRIVDLIMDAQAALAAEQVGRLSPASILRIDRRPERPIALDETNDATRDELLALADAAAGEAQAGSRALWRRFAAHRGAWATAQVQSAR